MPITCNLPWHWHECQVVKWPIDNKQTHGLYPWRWIRLSIIHLSNQLIQVSSQIVKLFTISQNISFLHIISFFLNIPFFPNAKHGNFFPFPILHNILKYLSHISFSQTIPSFLNKEIWFIEFANTQMSKLKTNKNIPNFITHFTFSWQ